MAFVLNGWDGMVEDAGVVPMMGFCMGLLLRGGFVDSRVYLGRVAR